MIPKRIKGAVLTRDGHRCVLNLPGCTLVATCCDHRVGRGMGGNTALDLPVVLVAACEICNATKEDDASVVAELTRRGLRIRRSQKTVIDVRRCEDTPVEYPDGTVWKLTGFGREEVK